MDQRRFSRKSGRLSRAPLQGFWQPPPTLDAADPQVPWLPLFDPPPAGDQPYRPLVVGRVENPTRLAGWFGAGPPPADVAPPSFQPFGRALVAPQRPEFSVAVFRSALLAAVEAPPVARIIAGQQEQPRLASVLRSTQPTETPRQASLVVARQEQPPPTSVTRSPQPVETPVRSGLAVAPQAPQSVASVLRAPQGEQAASAPPPFAGLLVQPQAPQTAQGVTGGPPMVSVPQPTAGRVLGQAQEGRQAGSWISRAALEIVVSPDGASGAWLGEGHQRGLQRPGTWLRSSLPPEQVSEDGASGAEIHEGHQRWLREVAHARPWLLPAVAIEPAVPPNDEGASGAWFGAGQQAVLMQRHSWFHAGSPLIVVPAAGQEGGGWPVPTGRRTLRLRRDPEALIRAIAREPPDDDEYTELPARTSRLRAALLAEGIAWDVFYGERLKDELENARVERDEELRSLVLLDAAKRLEQESIIVMMMALLHDER